jgi:phosphotransferase system  glucose/maltose/N-acetylglucosamine-specific IIC component
VPRWAKSLVVVVLAFAAVPAAFIGTLLLYPLWSWIEATYGIESVGHSGPADWCFMVVYGVILAALLPLLWRNWRRRRARSKLS